jgi:hypothetical protein
VPSGYFPAGDYQLTATCASNTTPPFTATPLTLSSSEIPHQGAVTAEITGCSAQGGAYACALQVTLGVPLAGERIFFVSVSGGGLDPADLQVTAFQGCQEPPLLQLPWSDGFGVRMAPAGCTAGAVMTFGERVVGAAGATITQTVLVDTGATSTATFVLP